MNKSSTPQNLMGKLAKGFARFKDNPRRVSHTTATYYHSRFNKWLGLSVPALLALSFLFDISDSVIGAPGKAIKAGRDYFFLTPRIDSIQKRMEEEALFYRCNTGGIRFEISNTKALDHEGRKLLLKYISNSECSEDFGPPPRPQGHS